MSEQASHTSQFTRIIDGETHTFQVTIDRTGENRFVVSSFQHTPPPNWKGWTKPEEQSKNK